MAENTFTSLMGPYLATQAQMKQVGLAGMSGSGGASSTPYIQL